MCAGPQYARRDFPVPLAPSGSAQGSGSRSARPASAALRRAPTRSGMPAECTTTASRCPKVSTVMWRFIPLVFLPASKPRCPLSAPSSPIGSRGWRRGVRRSGLSLRRWASRSLRETRPRCHHRLGVDTRRIPVTTGRIPSAGTAIGSRCAHIQDTVDLRAHVALV